MFTKYDMVLSDPERKGKDLTSAYDVGDYIAFVWPQNICDMWKTIQVNFYFFYLLLKYYDGVLLPKTNCWKENRNSFQLVKQRSDDWNNYSDCNSIPASLQWKLCQFDFEYVNKIWEKDAFVSCHNFCIFGVREIGVTFTVISGIGIIWCSECFTLRTFSNMGVKLESLHLRCLDLPHVVFFNVSGFYDFLKNCCFKP